MESRKVTQEVRLRQWSELVREQKNSGRSIKSWCEERGIPRQQYFYWQRKLREAACTLMRREAPGTQAPKGWTLCAPASLPEMPEANPSSGTAEQVCLEVKGVRLLAGRDYPVEALAQLIRELSSSW